MRLLLLPALLLMLCLQSNAQIENWKAKKYFTAVSYNVENLFDTINDPNKSDKAFTPSSKKEWNTEKYYEKLDRIAFVLSEINKNEYPEIIGLVEVENDLVLEDLIQHQKIKPGAYKYVHQEGPDPRGIDCALLYRPEVFKYLSHKSFPVQFPFSQNRRTRDILYVKGLVKKDTIHVFVNHWSSRRGGAQETEKKRIQSATVLKHQLDSVLMIDTIANIIVMGDCNDQPKNKSLYEVVQAGSETDSLPLLNQMFVYADTNWGTYYFRGAYNVLDHLLINKKTLNKTKGFRPYQTKAEIFSPDTICYMHKNGDRAPSKSYGGNNYYGGFSDHFAIYTYFYEK